MKKIINDVLDAGLVPYIATSQAVLPYLDLTALGEHAVVKLLEDPAALNFHQAYLLSNSLAFGNPNLKMPGWVYIDCVLMQSAVVGFAIPVAKAPAALRAFYEADENVDIATLDYIPVSGQIAALGLDGTSLIGFSLFSLRQYLENAPTQLGARTKYAAFAAYRAAEKEKFTGISQYDNKALIIHALFSDKMYIDQPIMPLHPHKDMSFTYSMKVKLDEDRVFGKSRFEEAPYDFLLRADDKAMKEDMLARMTQGEQFYITTPVHIKKEDGVYLPVCVERK